MAAIVTRFPPSPTGALHLGGARTALFNWLYARRMGGRFIFRLEDTDVERSKQEYTDSIIEAMKWLGVDWDDGPFYQSKRTEIYLSFIEKLVQTGKAYYCTCSQQTLEEKREQALKTGGKPKYDGLCREKGLPKTADAVVRLKTPLAGKVVFDDAVKGTVAFSNEELDDLVICRSDGTPTYHLAVVVDDITMGVNTVIRGDDHLSNTPRQIHIYQALGEPLPLYAHVPMVLGPDKKRLSKRHGARSVLEYRDMGILPQALINFLVRLGWSCGDQEFFTANELKEKFNLESIGRSAGVFDPQKLLDINGDHIRAAKVEDLLDGFRTFASKQGLATKDDTFDLAVIETLKIRAKTLEEMAQKAAFYYTDKVDYEQKASEKFLTPQNRPVLEAVVEALDGLDVSDLKAQEAAFEKVMEKTGLGFGKIAQPVRVALTGSTASPGLFEMIAVLGGETTIRRINDTIGQIKA
jgi:glutamyl-tRNA synthetase